MNIQKCARLTFNWLTQIQFLPEAGHVWNIDVFAAITKSRMDFSLQQHLVSSMAKDTLAMKSIGLFTNGRISNIDNLFKIYLSLPSCLIVSKIRLTSENFYTSRLKSSRFLD